MSFGVGGACMLGVGGGGEHVVCGEWVDDDDDNAGWRVYTSK